MEGSAGIDRNPCYFQFLSRIVYRKLPFATSNYITQDFYKTSKESKFYMKENVCVIICFFTRCFVLEPNLHLVYMRAVIANAEVFPPFFSLRAELCFPPKFRAGTVYNLCSSSSERSALILRNQKHHPKIVIIILEPVRGTSRPIWASFFVEVIEGLVVSCLGMESIMLGRESLLIEQSTFYTKLIRGMPHYFDD